MEEKYIYRYEESFKQLIISLIESGKIGSIEKARKMFVIGGHNTIQKWLKKAGKEYLIPKVGTRTLQLEIAALKENASTETYRMIKQYAVDMGFAVE